MDLGRYAAPAFSTDAPIADIVDDAALISVSAVRLAAKNLIIVRALRDRADYHDDWYVSAIRSEFEALAAEKDHDARRVEREQAAARTKRGRGTHPTDYRAADVVSLGRRTITLHALTLKLREMATDVPLAHSILAAARVDALDEMTASIRHPSTNREQLPEALRARALSDLAADLAALSPEPTHEQDVGGRT